MFITVDTFLTSLKTIEKCIIYSQMYECLLRVPIFTMQHIIWAYILSHPWRKKDKTKHEKKKLL